MPSTPLLIQQPRHDDIYTVSLEWCAVHSGPTLRATVIALHL